MKYLQNSLIINITPDKIGYIQSELEKRYFRINFCFLMELKFDVVGMNIYHWEEGDTRKCVTIEPHRECLNKLAAK
jgi:hypothetical protein